MGHTKGDRRADLIARANTYQIPIKLSWGQLDEAIDNAKYEVFSEIFSENQFLFRASAAFADGDPWPANFFGLAGRYYVPGTPNTPVRFVNPGILASVDRNARIAATANAPVVFMCDGLFHTLPDTTTVTIEHFLFPAPLEDPSIVDTATDSMPEWSEPDIITAAFESMLKELLDQQTALVLNQQEVERIEKQLLQVYRDKFEVVDREPQLKG